MGFLPPEGWGRLNKGRDALSSSSSRSKLRKQFGRRPVGKQGRPRNFTLSVMSGELGASLAKLTKL